MDEVDKLELFKHGLEQWVRNELNHHMFKTLEEEIKVAKKLIDYHDN